MKSDKKNLLSDSDTCSHHDSVMSPKIIMAKQRRKERYNFTLGMVSGLFVSLVVILFLFAGHPKPLINDGQAKPSPSQSVHTIVEQVEIKVDITAQQPQREISSEQESPVQVMEQREPQESSPASQIVRGPSNATCGITSDDRFDCWPKFWLATEFECASRGCCWDPNIQKGVPFCFYPADYVSYSATASKPTATGMTATLTRKTTSPYPNDVVELQFDVVFQSDNIVRFRIYDPNNKRYEVPLNLTKGPPNHTGSGDYVVTLQQSPFGILIRRSSTGATLFDSRNMAPLVFSDQFIQIGTRFSTPNVYGLGEHQASLRLDINWNKLVLWTRDEAPDGGGNLYGSHPFYLNLEADGKAHGVLLLNSNAMEVALQPYAGGQGAVTYRTLGGILDFFVFTGPTPLQVVEQYVSLIGRPFMPPFWSLGFHLCKYGYGSAKVLNEVIQRNRAANIPYDVQWNDIDYMDAYKDWTYDANKTYVGLPEIVDDLHSHNQRYIMIIDPGISSIQKPGTYPPFDDGVKMDIFIKNATGQILIGKVWPGLTAFPDFFHPKADDYWFQQMQSYFQTIKFDGIWIDMNEISNFVDGSTNGCTKGPLDKPPYIPPGINGKALISRAICPSALQYPSTSYNLHNMYGWSETRSTAAGLRKLLGKRSFVLSRSSFVGSGHYGAHWTGDNVSGWSDMYYSIPSILNLNMFGVPMVGADVCGFQQNTTRELCIRWMQLAAFYPFARNHADKPVRKPQDPASFDKVALGYMRDALNTRYSLLPFMYTWFYLGHATGTPVVRALFTMFPNTESIDKQFMWGDAILVSPVLEEGAVKVDAYFPKAVWYDLNKATKLETAGEETLVLDAPIDTINVHIRGGSIIPRLPPAVTTNEMRTKPFFLQVAPDIETKAQGLLYWDDGEVLDPVETNKYSLINFTLNDTTLSSQVQAANFPGMKLDSVQVFGINIKPTSVMLNGKTPVKFAYEDSPKVLSFLELNIDLLTAFTITWQYHEAT
ncbi:lysosomal alpha-glucosidase-like isoform X3 [Littorina saxatilis]|uniref:lysosomal alpha-glucosidase-like isoform X3 n=1 Tax=Littorina saxatilis TaxID=31220 RepID=UPI0038B428A1